MKTYGAAGQVAQTNAASDRDQHGRHGNPSSLFEEIHHYTPARSPIGFIESERSPTGLIPYRTIAQLS
jgi:hypothetical protein